MRRHTLTGERILAAAPALGGAAKLVRTFQQVLAARDKPPTAGAAV